MPLISVIVPVYKVEPYLQRCVDSILGQTYADFELILVDDGSPDNCGAICDEYAAKDSRVVVIHQENKGLPAARNAGLNVACGEYIASCDSDDYWEHNLLETVYKTAETEKADCVIFNYYVVDENGNTHKHRPWKEQTWEITSPKERMEFLMGSKDTGWEMWTRFFRREVFEKYQIRGCLTCNGFAEDLGFTTVYNMFATKVVCINEWLYYYFKRSDSIMGQSAKRIRLNDLNEVSRYIYSYYSRYFRNKEDDIRFGILHFLVMYAGYMKLINTPSYITLPVEIEKINNKNYFRKQTKKIFLCYPALKTYYGKDFARRIILLSSLCLHGNWKRFCIESAIYYKYILKR